jgi:hypothetical protein
MSWIRHLVTRFTIRAPHPAAARPPTLQQDEPDDDAFAELVAASSFLDFGGACIESKFNGSVREREIDRGLPPW